ncbi:MAG: gluconate 2-dehydrogenase subunit 3 family protein, partial [Gemmatimonadaceae bacterium]|nr:gluconate 2-dehydrogenase subunit 3 family protein [Gemmatimonadaceae bacterium]
AAHGVPFVEATPAQRLALIERFDREAYQFMRRRPDDEPPHWFRMLKELTMLGFFTSEAGMTQALRYVESPGRFDPCVPHAPGERDWAGHA